MMRECTYDPERSEVNQSCWIYLQSFKVQFYYYTKFDAFEISLANAPDYSIPSYPKNTRFQGTFNAVNNFENSCNYNIEYDTNMFLSFTVIKK